MDAGEFTRWRTDTTIRARRVMVPALLLALLAALAPVQNAEAHAPHDVISDLAVSPRFTTDTTLLVISRKLLLKSTDGGATWSSVVNGLRGPLSAVEISPAEASIVYASSSAGHGVFRSLDRGDSWDRVTDGIETPALSLLVASPHSGETAFAGGEGTGLIRTTDAGETWESIPTSGQVTAVAFSPLDADRVYRGTATGDLEISSDGGRNWSVLASRPGDGIATIAETVDGLVLASTADGRVLRLEGTADSRRMLSELPIDEGVLSVVADGTDVWAVDGATGPLVSTDGGESWTLRAIGLTTNPQADEISNAEETDFSRLRIVGSGGPLFLGGFNGLFRSDDEGRNWTEVETLEGVIVGLAVSPAFADDATIAVSTYVDGVHISRDGGQSWQVAGTDLLRRADDPDRKSIRLFNVVFSPGFADNATIYTTTIHGFVRSTDAGATWSITNLDQYAPDPGRNRIDIVVPSPAYRSDGALYMGTEQGGILRSADEGKTFSELARLEGSITQLVLSPSFSSDGTMFALVVPRPDAAERRVWKSADRGVTWTATDLDADGQLAISPAFGEDGTIFAGRGRAIWVSRDGGNEWTVAKALGDDGERVMAIAVSPTFDEDGIVLASVRGVGLYRSDDQGETFDPVASDPIDHNHLVADFVKPTARPFQFSPTFSDDQTVYAFAGRDVIVSTDGGESWALTTRPAAAAPDRPSDLGHGARPGGESRILVFVLAAASIALFAVAVTMLRARTRAR